MAASSFLERGKMMTVMAMLVALAALTSVCSKGSVKNLSHIY